MVREFHLDLRQVLFDTANFFPHIDTFYERSTLTQRDHCKERSNSLRIFKLALLVTTDFQLPLLHAAYPDNHPDASTFPQLTTSLTQRLHEISDGMNRVTLIFNEDNNSKTKLTAVKESPFHFIGSLYPLSIMTC